MTDDLVTWLRAQLDEDERAARELERVGLDTVMPGAIIDHTGSTVFFAAEVYQRLLRVLDPASVLRDIESQRRVVDLCAESILAGTGGLRDEFYCGYYLDKFNELLRALALPFSDRPGYRKEWTP